MSRHFKKINTDTHEFQCKLWTIFVDFFILTDYGQKPRPVDIHKLMPTQYELPSEMFEIHLPQSENPTINLCDAIVRKANLLNEKFRGNRQPEYMMHGQHISQKNV